MRIIRHDNADARLFQMKYDQNKAKMKRKKCKISKRNAQALTKNAYSSTKPESNDKETNERKAKKEREIKNTKQQMARIKRKRNEMILFEFEC